MYEVYDSSISTDSWHAHQLHKGLNPPSSNTLYFHGEFLAVAVKTDDRLYFVQMTDLPFSLYSTFVIEERHGFNKQTFWLFIRDMIKGMFLGVIIGPPIVAAIILIVQKGGPYIAIYLWGFMFVFSIVMMTIYPVQSVEHGENVVGSRIKIWSHKDEISYGVVKSYDCTIKMHKVLYDNGYEGFVHLEGQKWELVENVSVTPDSVRYESRKKLENQRPRVKGQFFLQGKNSNSSPMEVDEELATTKTIA